MDPPRFNLVEPMISFHFDGNVEPFREREYPSNHELRMARRYTGSSVARDPISYNSIQVVLKCRSQFDASDDNIPLRKLGPPALVYYHFRRPSIAVPEASGRHRKTWNLVFSISNF